MTAVGRWIGRYKFLIFMGSCAAVLVWIVSNEIRVHRGVRADHPSARLSVLSIVTNCSPENYWGRHVWYVDADKRRRVSRVCHDRKTNACCCKSRTRDACSTGSRYRRGGKPLAP